MAAVTDSPALQDTSLHDTWLKTQLEDPEFKAEFERERREIAAIDAIVNALDDLRAELGVTKAMLAREIGKNPASVRRLLTAQGNPELRTIVAVAEALGAQVKIVPPPKARRRLVVAHLERLRVRQTSIV